MVLLCRQRFQSFSQLPILNVLELWLYRPYRLVHKWHKKGDVWMMNDGHVPCDHRIVNLKGTCTVQWHESIESSVRVVGSHVIKPNGGGGRGVREGRWIFSPSQSLPRVVRWLVRSCRLVFSDLTGGWRRLAVTGYYHLLHNLFERGCFMSTVEFC